MVTLTGTVEGIIFQNEENGYTVFVLCVDNNQFETVTGTFPMLREGDFVTVWGNYVEHDSYGQQLKAESYEIVTPQTPEEIENYLASGIVSGIGPKIARDIVDMFGAQTLKIMENSPERLCEVSGIGRKKAAQIKESYGELMGAQRTVMFLQKYGVTPNLALKIYSFYGDGTIPQLKSNPYKLVSDIEGVGFLTADKIASEMGIDSNSKYRISACIRYLLTEAGNEGHTFLPQEVLSYRASVILNCSQDKIVQLLPELGMDQSVVLRNVAGVKAVYHPSFFYAEALVAGSLMQLQDSVDFSSEKGINKEIDSYEKNNGIELAENQRQAVISAMNNGICVITGGPGTGKTTTLDCILNLFRKRGMNIALTAPTGRAAKRMSSATGEEAKTIHRLLEYSKTESGFIFKRNKDHPVDCSVCIVDEASMIDIFLMQALLDGLKRGTRLILVGDVDQLPSVGAGNVLGDIISSGVFPVVALNHIFRQASQSMIVVNAHKINNGEMPLVNTKGSDFFLERKHNETEICANVVDLCLRRLPKAYGIDPIKDIQVLTPIKKGACGVFNLNTVLQKALNPAKFGVKEHNFGEKIFREGDKVIQIRNNYERQWNMMDSKGLLVQGTGMFNGDSGIITEIDEHSRKVTVLFEDGRICDYEYTDVDELELAYALSVHKSQGCEFKYVIMPLPMGNIRIMTRNLLYTAVTRASKMVIISGSETSLFQMINNTDTQKRYSALNLRLGGVKDFNG